MFFSSILLSLFIAIISFSAWFGILETINCTHRADRIYFVGMTRQLNQPEKQSDLSIRCAGNWKFHFAQKSKHHRRKISHQLNDWGVPRE